MNPEAALTCPACGNHQFTIALKTRDFAVSGEEFSIISCTHCNLWITSPVPEEHELARYYQSATYISHQTKSRSLLDAVYFMARRLMLRKKLRLITKHQPPGRLLDYGCGIGSFVAYAKGHGWDATGYEPTTVAQPAASAGATITTNPNDLEGTFDVITLWHVLEHLPRLRHDVQQIEKMLAPGGLLVIAVPNRESWDAQHYQTHWAALDVPRHVWHFNPGNIENLLQKFRLQLVDRKPLILDSFFVSLLSERYKKTPPPIHLIKAVWHGFVSNLKAQQTKNYSSVIYFARK